MINPHFNPFFKKGDTPIFPQIKVAFLTWDDDYKCFEEHTDFSQNPEIILKHPDVKILPLQQFQNGFNNYEASLKIGHENLNDIVATIYFFVEP